MRSDRLYTTVIASAVMVSLAGCGGLSSSGSGLFGRNSNVPPTESQLASREAADAQRDAIARIEGKDKPRSTIWDLFSNADNPNTTVEVNKYIWNASLDVLNFLPIESIDPFTGVIVTGYGTPPGGGRAYRATIYVQDPALDARSLRIAMQARGGAAVSAETIRAIEDAILTRARQLRIADSKL